MNFCNFNDKELVNLYVKIKKDFSKYSNRYGWPSCLENQECKIINEKLIKLELEFKKRGISEIRHVGKIGRTFILGDHSWYKL